MVDKIKNMIAIAFLIVMIVPCNLYASSDITMAIPNNIKVIINEKTYTFEAYNIMDYNYVKLRDIAVILNNTEACFSVNWDEENKAISLFSGKPYIVIGSELSNSNSESKNATLNNAKIIVNDEFIETESYIINDNSYFRLRDIGEIIGFEVDWDSNSNTIVILIDGSNTNEEPKILNTFDFDHNTKRIYTLETVTESGRNLTITVELYWHSEEMLRGRWKNLFDKDTLDEIFEESSTDDTFMVIVSMSGAITMQNIHYVYSKHTLDYIKVDIIHTNHDRLGIVELLSGENGIHLKYEPASKFRSKYPSINTFIPLSEEIDYWWVE